MRNSTRSVLYGLSGALLAVTVPRVVMRLLRHLTSALLILCVCSSSALARPSGLFGPRQNPPRAASPNLTTDEARQIAEVLSECETLAVELDSTRAETRVLRQALELTKKAASAFEAASVLNAERADNEKKRADNEAVLRVTAEEKYKAERRAGRWRALRWAGAALGIGAVIGFVAAGQD